MSEEDPQHEQIKRLIREDWSPVARALRCPPSGVLGAAFFGVLSVGSGIAAVSFDFIGVFVAAVLAGASCWAYASAQAGAYTHDRRLESRGVTWVTRGVLLLRARTSACESPDAEGWDYAGLYERAADGASRRARRELLRLCREGTLMHLTARRWADAPETEQTSDARRFLVAHYRRTKELSDRLVELHEVQAELGRAEAAAARRQAEEARALLKADRRALDESALAARLATDETLGGDPATQSVIDDLDAAIGAGRHRIQILGGQQDAPDDLT